MTGCTHAAVWVNPDGTLAGGVEDVGRHVALDKLLGLRALNGWKEGALFVSSRASFEMVQKAAMCGVEILFAVSAPTALAVDLAKRSGLTLSAFCRPGRGTVYTSCEAKRRAEVSTSRKKQKSGGRRQLFPPVACRRKEKFPRMESIFLSKSIGNKDFSFFREQIRR